ncbi:MAG: type I 3-dehydroquinate dehydratase [Deltaproteobacteria bacterium]|nr:type I 3-dehydroquinate dehydratase [Deltaproteobacteria bacterium]
MICLTGNETEPKKIISRLTNFSGLNEIRLDFLSDIPSDIIKILSPWKSKVIITHRHRNFSKSINLLSPFISENFFLVDIELDKYLSSSEYLNSISKDNLLISWHGDADLFLDALKIFRQLPDYRYKFAVKIKSVDQLKYLKASIEEFPGSIVIATGQNGLYTRLRYQDFGSYLTFLSLNSESITDSGQIPYEKAIASRILENNLNPVFLLGGQNVFSSPGMRVYNRIFKKNSFPFCYINQSCEDIPDLKRFLTITNSPGCSITMPLKTDLMKQCDNIDKTSEISSSVNTVILRNNKLSGFNTDFLAFTQIFKENSFKNVVIAGNGATSKTAVGALKELGFSGKITLLPRNSKLTEKVFSDTLFINTLPLEVNSSSHPFDITNRRIKSSILLDLPVWNRNFYSVFDTIIPGDYFWRLQGIPQIFLITGQSISMEDIEADFDLY